MNIRSFSIAILVSAIPLLASAETSNIALNKGDFISAERLTQDGETVLSVKLSKSGKAKLKKLNEQAADKKVHAEITTS